MLKRHEGLSARYFGRGPELTEREMVEAAHVRERGCLCGSRDREGAAARLAGR